jgi:AcrR family transcriptional regulator
VSEARTGSSAGPGLQRARILDAMVAAVGEQGFSAVTVSGLCARAGVSRATFYASFDGLQACFLAVLDDGHRRAYELIEREFAAHDCWRAGVRGALGALLELFDEEPSLARVWFVESLAAGAWALERRERNLRTLTAMMSARWPLPQGSQVNPLAAAGVVESILGILHAQLLDGSNGSLVELLGPLMGLIGAIYLGPHAAAVERERGDAHARVLLAARRQRASVPAVSPVEVPGVLRDPRAHRARECLHHLAGNPGASNMQIATAVGIARREQISKLLARLDALGLLVKCAGPPGTPNAWSLTPHGRRVAGALQSHRKTEDRESAEANM